MKITIHHNNIMGNINKNIPIKNTTGSEICCYPTETIKKSIQHTPSFTLSTFLKNCTQGFKGMEPKYCVAYGMKF